MRNQLMWSIYSVSLGLGHRWADTVYRRGRYDLIYTADVDAIERIAREDDRFSPVKGIHRPNIQKQKDGTWAWIHVSPSQRVVAVAEQKQDAVKTWVKIQRPFDHSIKLSLNIDENLYAQVFVDAHGVFEQRHALLFREIFSSVQFYLKPRIPAPSSNVLAQLLHLSGNSNVIWCSEGRFRPLDKYYLYDTSPVGEYLRVYGAYTRVVSENRIAVVENNGEEYEEYLVEWQKD